MKTIKIIAGIAALAAAAFGQGQTQPRSQLEAQFSPPPLPANPQVGKCPHCGGELAVAAAPVAQPCRPRYEYPAPQAVVYVEPILWAPAYYGATAYYPRPSLDPFSPVRVNPIPWPPAIACVRQRCR